MKQVWLVSMAAGLVGLASCGSGNADLAAKSQDGGSAATGSVVEPQAVATADLKAAVSDERVRKFYEDRDWRTAWTAQNASALLDALRNADRHGLASHDYLAAVDAADTPAKREAALTRAALDFADALADGKLDPTAVFDIYTIPRPQVDVVGGLEQAIEAGNTAKWLDSLAPQDPQYRALSQAFLDYSRQAAKAGGQGIESGDLIHAGESDPRVPRIVQVLQDNRYLGQDNGSQPDLYTQQIADAVERMQQDFGIAADGVVGPDTLEVLNTGPAQRARILAVNLERLRWLERNPPATRIDVNTAAATLDYFRDGTLRDERKVIVGQPGWETPHLQAPMFRLVANPTWTVPKSIEKEEIPNSASYLRRHNMERRNGWIVQLPGPDNALGQVKFDMQDDYAIYLHDTPAKSLFERNQRQLSHGCVRVDNALQFARMIAQDAGVLQQYQQARASGDETFVRLPESIPVRLLYQTAFVDGSGNVRFRTDPYGWDDRIAEKLGYEPHGRRRLQSNVSDIGP